MRIVHFSDIHVGRVTLDPTALFDKRLLGLANHFLRRHGAMDEDLVRLAASRVHALKPDIVVCTGDLTCVGSPVEFDAARTLLKPMPQAKAYEFYAVPGNHDAYVRNRSCSSALQATFAQLNSAGVCLDAFPVEVRRGGLRLFFVNSALPRAPWSSNGRLSVLSRQWLKAQTRGERAPGERRILVGHFPARDGEGRRLSGRRRLDDGGVLADLLDEGRIDMALCGHIHTSFRRDEPSGAVEVCAGSLPVSGRLNVVDYCPVSGELIQQWEDVRRPSASGVGLAKSLVPAKAAPCS